METKYIKKRIIENSEFSYVLTSDSLICKIICIGIESSVVMQFNHYTTGVVDTSNITIDESIKNLLVNSLIENNKFLEKFEKFENRNRNLDTLI